MISTENRSPESTLVHPTHTTPCWTKVARVVTILVGAFLIAMGLYGHFSGLSPLPGKIVMWITGSLALLGGALFPCLSALFFKCLACELPSCALPACLTSTSPPPYDFGRLEFREALTANKGIKQLTEDLDTRSFAQLDSAEADLLHTLLVSTEWDNDNNRQALLHVFENRKSSFVKGRNEDGGWVIAARLQCTKNNVTYDGVIRISQTTHDGKSSSWWVNCKFYGLTWADTQVEFRDITFDEKMYANATKDFKWVKRVLAGEVCGLVTTVANEHYEDRVAGQISLWLPPPE